MPAADSCQPRSLVFYLFSSSSRAGPPEWECKCSPSIHQGKFASGVYFFQPLANSALCPAVQVQDLSLLKETPHVKMEAGKKTSTYFPQVPNWRKERQAQAMLSWSEVQFRRLCNGGSDLGTIRVSCYSGRWTWKIFPIPSASPPQINNHIIHVIKAEFEGWKFEGNIWGKQLALYTLTIDGFIDLLPKIILGPHRRKKKIKTRLTLSW